MAAQPLTGGLGPDLHLSAGCIVRVNAISPTTGAQVAGVRATNVLILVSNVGGGLESALDSGSFRLVPGPGA